MTQTILIQSYEDKFEIPGGYHLVTPAIAGSILMKHDPNDKLIPER